ncbi:MAG: hypothetical protein NVS4B12_23690 [Ktedonobacteraceae bacterium]
MPSRFVGLRHLPCNETQISKMWLRNSLLKPVNVNHLFSKHEVSTEDDTEPTIGTVSSVVFVRKNEF